MGDTTEIAWTDHTFNPWEGCQKVGPGCDHCYAEARNARFGGGIATNWGPGAPRRRTGASNWRKPLKWNREAEAEGRRHRVFCASLADVFDNAVDPRWRADLFQLIRETPSLDWQLLTKRIGNVCGMLPDDWSGGYPNVWLGATVVNQEEADRDIPKLLNIPARIRFLSIEPLLGPVDLTRLCIVPQVSGSPRSGIHLDALAGRYAAGPCPPETEQRRLDWVIVGGESGKGARPMHPDWVRSLRDQCAAAGTAFFFKQWGEWVPQCGAVDGWTIDDNPEISRFDHRDWEGDQWGKPYRPMWCDDRDDDTVSRVGKKAAGSMLDGFAHREFPA